MQRPHIRINVVYSIETNFLYDKCTFRFFQTDLLPSKIYIFNIARTAPSWKLAQDIVRFKIKHYTKTYLYLIQNLFF